MPPLLSPGEAIKNVNVVFEGPSLPISASVWLRIGSSRLTQDALRAVGVAAAAPKMAGEGESKVFVIQGIEVRPRASLSLPLLVVAAFARGFADVRALPLRARPVPPPREPTPEDDSDDDEGNGGGPSNRAVLSRLAEVEGKLDRVLAALGK